MYLLAFPVCFLYWKAKKIKFKQKTGSIAKAPLQSLNEVWILFKGSLAMLLFTNIYWHFHCKGKSGPFSSWLCKDISGCTAVPQLSVNIKISKYANYDFQQLSLMDTSDGFIFPSLGAPYIFLSSDVAFCLCQQSQQSFLERGILVNKCFSCSLFDLLILTWNSLWP